MLSKCATNSFAMKTKLSFLFGLVSLLSFAQGSIQDIGEDPFYVNEQIPSSPEAASLGEFGKLTATAYNGKANISIPIHTISWEGKQIPIVLNYDSGGVQVAAEASWVGLNWTLSTNYGIQRKVYGGDDFNEELAGYYPAAPKAGYLYNGMELVLEPTASRPYYDYTEIMDVHHSFGKASVPSKKQPFMDTQPDVYSLNIFGKSYKFILEQHQGSNTINAIVFNSNNAQITFDLANSTFTLVDDDGFIYEFETKEYNTSFSASYNGELTSSSSGYAQALANIFANPNKSENGLVTGWLLDKVTSPRGRELNFNYTPGMHFSFPSISVSTDGRDSETFVNWPQEQFSFLGFNSTSTISTSISENNYLQSITGEFGTVEFILGDRDDLSTGHTIDELSNGGYSGFQLVTGTNTAVPSCHGENSCGTSLPTPKLLDKVQVRDFNSNLIFEADLQHSYFNSNYPFGTPERYYRLKLDGVTILDREYGFSYINENSLPNKDSFGVDFWGFANGITNSTLVPRYGRFVHTELLSPGNVIRLGQSFVSYPGANRKSDFNFGKNGLLERVTYPTKGYTEIEYQAHSVVLETPSAFVKTKDFTENADYSGVSRIQWTNMIDEAKYSSTYQYMKYAEDASYNYFTKTPPVIQGDPINLNIDLYESFTVDFPSVMTVQGEMRTQTGWDGLSYWGNNPLIVLVDLNSGQETTLFTFADAPTDYGNPSTTNYVDKTFNVLPGTYALQVRSITIPPGANYADYPPTPGVEYQSTSNVLYTYDSIAGDLSEFLEQFEVGGARVAKITNRDSDNSFISATAYKYEFPGYDVTVNSSGKLMDDLIFHSKASGMYSYSPRGYADFRLTSSNMVGGNNSAQGSHIGYSFVEQFQVDAGGNTLGMIENEYHNDKNGYFTSDYNLPYEFAQFGGPNFLEIIRLAAEWKRAGSPTGALEGAFDPQFSSPSGYAEIKNTVVLGVPLRLDFSHINGMVRETRVFNAAGDLLEKTVNTYESLNGNVPQNYYASFLNIGMQTNLDPVTGEVASNIWSSVEQGLWGENHHTYFPYLFPLHHGLEAKPSTSLKYNYLDGDLVLNESESFYDATSHQLKTQKVIVGETDELTTNMYYPDDAEVYDNPNVVSLRLDNRKSTLIKAEQFRNTQKLSTVQYNYSRSTETKFRTLLGSISRSKAGEALTERQKILSYDMKGNVLEKQVTDGPIMSYIWGYNDQYPIAKIENASYEDIRIALSLSDIAAVENLSEADLGQINGLRDSLPNAMITTYEYLPMIGIAKVTDPRGYTSHYEYDANNRLQFVKDKDGFLLSENQYNYKD